MSLPLTLISPDFVPKPRTQQSLRESEEHLRTMHASAPVEMQAHSSSAQGDDVGRGAEFSAAMKTATHLSPTSPQAPIALDGCRGKILLVEDHSDTAKTLSRLLSISGYNVSTAHSVSVALAIASEQSFDVVISDIGLPDASGYELMKQLRDRHNMRGIALSGYGMEEDMRRSREAGFIHHLVKPVNFMQLQQVIERVAHA